MAVKPRISKTVDKKPSIKSVEGTVTDATVKPRIVKTEELKPSTPSAES